jgi:hypothetical protein
MLTLRVIKPDQSEELFEATKVEHLPMGAANTDPGVIAHCANGTSTHFAISNASQNKSRMYVMNSAGATVASYTL